MKQEGLFHVEELPQVKGKSLEALAYSRQRREDLLAMFNGEVPASIMRKTSVLRTEEEDIAYGSYEQTGYRNEALNPILQDAFSVSMKGVAWGALSIFPQNIGRAVLLLYSEPGDCVVDPFAGHNSRMDLCVRESRHYIGYDISERFMTFNKERADTLRRTVPDVEIILHHGDSRTMDKVRDGIGDFTLTSPPYYDIEDYGDEAAQLGKCPTYEAFLDDLQRVMAENFRCLRSGAYAVWFVNDFRRDKKMFFYHVDVMERMKQVGFIAHDIMIVDLGNAFREAFIGQIVDQRILPKRHEYGLVFRKP